MRPPSWWYREVLPGDEGDDVLIAQRKLRIPMTGVMDALTVSRVRGYQKEHGLEVTGTMDDKTAAELGEKEAAGQVPEWYSRELAEPDSGKDVEALRVALKQPNLPAYFDRALADAVRRFQAAAGLETSGVVDRDTAVALADRLA